MKIYKNMKRKWSNNISYIYLIIMSRKDKILKKKKKNE